MGNSKVEEDRARYRFAIARMAGSMPWLKPKEVREYRAKVFKSGNSLALRLPAAVGLKPGMEMNLRVENECYFSFEPIEAPKRPFNIDKIWGSASGLKLIAPEDRLFVERKLPWPETDHSDGDDQ